MHPRDSYANYFSGEIASTLGRSDEALDFYRYASGSWSGDDVLGGLSF